MSNEKLFTLQEKLAKAIDLCNYWTARRRNQVNNCPSDTYATDEAWRVRQSLEFQIRELKKTMNQMDLVSGQFILSNSEMDNAIMARRQE